VPVSKAPVKKMWEDDEEEDEGLTFNKPLPFQQ
jgi:hypothetical protein